MVLQGTVESKEAKGYIIDLGFKDGSKGFLKVAKDEDGEKAKKRSLRTGQIVQVVAKNVIETSKVIKCEQLKPGSHGAAEDCVHPAAEDKAPVTVSHLKPGFLVSAKVQRVFDNGIELTFMRGITGTCFADHASAQIAQATISNYKVGEKVLARIISTDPIHKTITLSMNENIVRWCPASSTQSSTSALSSIKVGHVFKNAKVSKVLYGGSYLLCVQ